MKPYLAELVAAEPRATTQAHIIREYLQARLLNSFQNAGAMLSLAFQGGTALRFLYAIPRFSEDLDFALECPQQGYDLKAWLRRARRDLEAEDYEVTLKISERRAVHAAFVKFPGLLAAFIPGEHPRRVLSIKVEVDTRPPKGAVWETTVVRRYVALQLQHHDQASLLAGKLHALMNRPYVKGRDLYDLFWYLSQSPWPEPNLALLRNALVQSGWQGTLPEAGSWRQIVLERLENLDLQAAVADVSPFLMHTDEARFLNMETFRKLLA